MNIETKRGFKMIASIIMMGVALFPQVLYGIEHHNMKVIIAAGIVTAANAWIYTKWWILEGKA
jgi:hypothetical protein